MKRNKEAKKQKTINLSCEPSPVEKHHLQGLIIHQERSKKPWQKICGPLIKNK